MNSTQEDTSLAMDAENQQASMRPAHMCDTQRELGHTIWQNQSEKKHMHIYIKKLTLWQDQSENANANIHLLFVTIL